MATACFKPYLRISILELDNLVSVTFVITFIGFLCMPFKFSFHIKFASFLLCVSWTTLNFSDIRGLMENLINVRFIYMVEFSNSGSSLFNSTLSSLMQ